jgi:hypothetical protein
LLKIVEVEVRLLTKAQTAFNFNKIDNPPGSSIISILRLFLRKKQIAVVEAEIEDMRQEVYEALAEKRWLRARWLPVLYAIGLGWSALKWVVNELKGVPGKAE